MDDLDDLMGDTRTRAPRPTRQDLVGGTLLGIPLERLDFPLVRAEGNPTPPPDAMTRFRDRFPKYSAENIRYYGTLEQWWRDQWLSIPYKGLAAVFTPDELVRMWLSSPVASTISDHFYCKDDEHPLDHVVWKVMHSLHMWGSTDDYAVLVDSYEGLRNLSFGEGFEVRLDHTNSINERGTAVYSRMAPPKPLWLDGEFGLLVYYKGKHVLTIGFSPTAAGILIHQVQLREKRGNRFIYKLPKPILEHVIDCFKAAFPTRPILLIDGAEAVRRVRKGYGARAKTDFDTTGAAERMLALYDRPLNGYVREPVEAGVYAKCYRVVPVAEDALAAA